MDPIVEELHTARKRSGLTQKTITERMGTTQSALSELERGVTTPRLPTLRRWAEALGYDVSLTKREA